MTSYLRQPLFRDHPIAALAVICLSVFVISVDATIVNVALPTLSRELDADTAQLQWIVDAYTLVIAGMLLSAGSLSDRYGRRGWLSAGLALFAITSAVAAQVTLGGRPHRGARRDGSWRRGDLPDDPGADHEHLHRPGTAGQGDRGVGSHGGRWRGRRTDHRGLAAPTLLLGLDFPGQRAGRRGGHRQRDAVRSDFTRPGDPANRYRGLILSAIGVTALVYTVIEAPNWGWSSARTAVGFGVAVAVLAGFALWERRACAPMLDVSVFANRRFSGGSLAVTAGFLTLFGFIFVITQYFQVIKDYSAFETGVRMLPVAVSIAVASVLGPRLVERIGTTAVVAAGLAIFAAGLGWASTIDAATPYIQIAMQMVLLGGGLGLTTAPATESIMGSLSADKAGVGSAVNDTTRELGGTLGVAIVGSVFASVYSGRIGSASALAALPGDVRSTMEHSMAAAYKVIGQLPAARAAGVRDAVNHGFLHGMQVGALFCAAIALGAAVVVAGLLPARARQTAPSMTQQPKAAPAVA